MPPENNLENGDATAPMPGSVTVPTGPTTADSTSVMPTQSGEASTSNLTDVTPQVSSEPMPLPAAAPVEPASEPVISQPVTPSAMDVSPVQTPEATLSTPMGSTAGPTPSSSSPAMPLMQAQAPIAENKSPNDMPKPKKKSGLKVVLIVVVLFLVSGLIAGAYVLGKRSAPKQEAPTVTAKPITLPPEAIVTAECVPGRGKQYIIPKDIPVGPIYDVNNGNVIAIEYNISIVDLLSNPDTFSDTLNALMKNYSTDHFTLVPSPPKPGQQVSEVHLIMFVVPKEEAASITCGLTPEQLTQLQSGAQAAPTTETN